MIFWIVYLAGAATGLLSVAVYRWLSRRDARRQLPPGTRREIDNAARDNRPQLRISSKRGYELDSFYDEDTHP